jgi:DNA-binding MarR family transcriptional regulator/predicted GNAT family N-acyltransferase
MNFYSSIGNTALGSRLRRLSEQFLESGTEIYPLYEVDLDPKWFPVFYLLQSGEAMAITEIAREIGHSHPSVSQTVKEMVKKGVLETYKSKADARVTSVQISEKGRQIIPKLATQLVDVGQAATGLLDEMNYDLMKAIEEVEFLLSRKNFFERVVETRKKRERESVQIIDFQAVHAESFKLLNYEWIEKYFRLEESDHKALDNPQKIIADGGFIFMAMYEGEALGTVALIKMDDDSYELAKMAVTAKARGKHIGWLLSQACIAKVRAIGAKRLYLESNTILEPAINMYYKLGFVRIVGKPSPYERANIQMEMWV